VTRDGQAEIAAELKSISEREVAIRRRLRSNGVDQTERDALEGDLLQLAVEARGWMQKLVSVNHESRTTNFC
jgi:outer membrane lipopolysaccharide assembly protein LptE/RlpB